MKKFENFCCALENLKEIYNYAEPYDNVVLTGLVGLYEICFEQSWKMVKKVLEEHGFVQNATGSPRMTLETAYEAGMIGTRNSGFLHCAREITLLAHTAEKLP